MIASSRWRGVAPEGVSSVMVRTTRTQAGLDNVKRFATDHAIPLGRDEAALYRICTDMLRHHMNGDGDVVRRRVLAQRLVASPRSLAKSAFRMADAYPDPAVAGLLREIGHRAADLGTTQRSTVASEIISEWVREHGRVLVFSQHTDTVEGLMAALDKAGLSWSDITPTPLAPADATVAFSRGIVDAWSIWDPYLALAEIKDKVRVIAFDKDVHKPNAFYIAGSDFVAKYPSTVAKLNSIFAAEGKWAADHREEVARAQAEATGVDTAVNL